ncbi:MAG: YjbQ family protein [Acidobacteria bacterium]|nr:YjbQ family protein [Acidobacteriota bacterium]
MTSQLETLCIRSSGKQEMIDITPQLAESLKSSGIQNGFLGVFSQHTTAVLLVNEFQSALLSDIQDFLKAVIREDLPYKHNSPEWSDCDRNNAASHLRSLLFNNSVLLPVAGGKPILGQFQSVILAELDGPRERTLKLQFLGM